MARLADCRAVGKDRNHVDLAHSAQQAEQGLLLGLDFLRLDNEQLLPLRSKQHEHVIDPG